MSQLPLIRIKNARLLRHNASRHLHKLWGKEGEEMADDAWMERRVAEYQAAWQPFEQKVLTGMVDTLGVPFRQNVIDVYIAPWFRAFSDPVVIGVTKSPDVFVDVLTHELLHRLLTDNTAVKDNDKLTSEWVKLFGKNHSQVTLVHIPVHACTKKFTRIFCRHPNGYSAK